MPRPLAMLAGVALLMLIGWWSTTDGPGHGLATNVLAVALVLWFVGLLAGAFGWGRRR